MIEIYNAVLKATREKRRKTLFHSIEHAGYGGILSRLMTGLNLSLVLDSNYSFRVNSPYLIEGMFDIQVKQPPEEAAKNEIINWDFFAHTWNAPPEVRINQLFPRCPLQDFPSISRHQWCSILAYCICSSPHARLRSILDSTKDQLRWRNYDLRIGLHVRRGDKKTECPYIPSEVYVSFFNQVRRLHVGKKIAIFLASDDPACYDEFKPIVGDIDIIWDFEENRYNNYNAKMIFEHRSLAVQESLTSAKNICLLGDCDYVIGMARAQFTWIGGLLSVFKNNLDTKRHIMIDPYTNVQSHWACWFESEVNHSVKGWRGLVSDLMKRFKREAC